ncbi:MAG TPA: Ldh family oxidoreductase [Chloroflexota bacterium]|jgi:LDH2 family malate/lactate/ureidoglycolate dehydrogenase|nr:Ldh family oxidoreductase [Chloroflexota bacterium]
MPTIAADRLLALTRRIFGAAGTPADLAEVVADHLIGANLAGHDSHGVIRIPSYVGMIKRGALDPAARPRILNDRGALLLVDGNWAFGQVAARYGIDLAIRRAREQGAALVGIVRCNHIGRVGEYPTLAAQQGVAAFVTVGGERGSSVAPFGGRTGALGTNPISFGFPAARHPPFLVDFATSAIAGGKVMVARAKGEPVPPGCLIDAQGEPTQDPNAYFAGGALLPFGGHKGYGLSMMVSLFAGVLTQAAAHAGEGRGASGTLMIAIDAGAFGPAERTIADADAAIDRIKAVPPAPGVAEVLAPGEPEARSRERRQREGIPVPETTWAEIGATAQSLGVPVES